MSWDPKEIVKFSLASIRIKQLCMCLTRWYGLLDHKDEYTEDQQNNFNQEMKEIPLYRSFFQHKLFDKNMLHLIKEYVKDPPRYIFDLSNGPHTNFAFRESVYKPKLFVDRYTIMYEPKDKT